MLILLALRLPRGRRHRAVAVRAAGAAGAAVRRRRRRPAPAARASCSGCRSPSPSRSSGVAKVVDGVGLGSDPLRDVAVVVLLVFGVVLLLPASAGAHRGAPLAPCAFGPRSSGDGFFSGLLVGGALGFVYTPCASPILAAVISVSAASGKTIADRAGLRVRLGARAARAHARRQAAVRPRAPGRARPAAAARARHDHDPHGARDPDQPGRQIRPVHRPAHSQRQPDRVARVLEHRRPAGCTKSPATSRSSPRPTDPRRAKAPRANCMRRRPTRARRACSPTPAAARCSAPRPNSPKPRTGSTRPATAPCRWPRCTGRVVLVDFWTYTCINCIRTLPYLKAWDAAYRNQGLTIVGVETPEFAFEHEASNVSNAIGQFGLHYPVVQDNNMGTWNAYGNEDWPADYLIDANGQVRYTAVGEGDYSTDRNRDPRAARRSRLQRRRQEPPDRRGRALRRGHAGDLSGHQPRGRLDRPAQVRAARLRARPSGGLEAQRVRLQRHLEHRRPARRSGRERRHRRGVRRQERLPRAELARRTPARR